MKCSYCHTVNRDIARFCKECGRLLGTTCPNCGSELPDQAKFCDICGHNLAKPLVEAGRQAGETATAPAPVRELQSTQTHLHQYIPEELLAKLEAAAATGGMVGERRVVTILFCDMKGSTSAAEGLDPEEWTEIMNGAFELMIAPVYRYEGIVARLTGDGILAFFGAPIAHEDDAVRCILAGLEIVSETESYRHQMRQKYGIEIDVRVGINTGRVVVGAVGSDLRLEYTALGDAINLAARMEQLAEPGTVQIAENSYKLVAPLFEFEALGGIKVKGKKDPVNAYRVLGQKARPGRLRGIAGLESPLIGRKDEFTVLENALSDLQHGRGLIHYLVAQAGLGKSRLIRELHQHWGREEVVNQTVEFWSLRPVASYQASEPYRLLKNLIRLIYGIDESATPVEVRERLKKVNGHARHGELLDSDNQTAFSVLAKLLGVQEQGSDDMQFQGETFKQQLHSTTLASIRSLAQKKPLLLVLDDLHWTDPASIEAIEHLFPLVDSVPIFFLCATRPDTTVPSWDLKAAAEKSFPHRYSETILAPLSEENSLNLLGCLLPNLVWPDKLQSLILEKSEGNPFFIEEVVRTLINDGIVRQTDDRLWEITTDVEDFMVPGNLQALLAARFDRLSEADRQVLQVASVIGRTFRYDILKKVTGDSSSLDASLSSLQRSDLIIEESRIPERIYRFRNSLAQGALYRSILRKLRRDFHRKIGEAWLDLVGDENPDNLPVLAYHFYLGEDDRALIYNQRAGEVAYQLFAISEAATYYSRAVELVRKGATATSNQVAGIFSRYGRILELSSRFGEALEIYEEMRHLARENSDQEMELSALLSAGTVFSTANDQYDSDKAKELADEALAVAQELRDEASEAKIYWNLLNMYRLSEQPFLALKVGERSIELARKNNLKEQLAYSANDMTHVYFATGLATNGEEVILEAIQLWRELGNQAMLADSLATASMVYSFQGQADKAITLSDESYMISKRIDNLWGQSYSQFYIGKLYGLIGQPSKAIETMENCVRLGARAGFIPSQIYTAADLALLYAYIGNFDKAQERIREPLELASEVIPHYRAPTLAFLGLINIYCGQIRAADGIYEEITTSDSYIEPLMETLLEEFKCLYHLERNENQKALRHATNLVSIWKEINARTPLPGSRIYLGQALILGNELDQAAEVLSVARKEAEDLGLYWPLWQILALLGKVETKKGNTKRGKELQNKAWTIIKEIAEKTSSAEQKQLLLNHPYWKKHFLD